MPPIGGWKGGVYAIRNLVNQKIYVGSTIHKFQRRWNLHLCLLKLSKHGNRHLQSAWNKYGEDNFEIIILRRCKPTLAVIHEQEFINEFRSANRKFGYNITPTAGSPLGMKLTMEQRKKIGDHHRGKVTSEETKQKIGNANRGRKLAPRSDEYRRKLSLALKGKRKTKAHRQKLSAATIKYYASRSTR